MLVIYGQKPYGKCDVVPELFYVSTWFFHVNFFPLIPMGTRLILGKSGDSYQVVRLPFSFKSLLLAWGRTALVMAAAGGWIGVIASVADDDRRGSAGPLLAVAIAVALTAVTVAMFIFFKKASYKRACALATRVGLTPQAWAALNVLYGREPETGPVDTTFVVR